MAGRVIEREITIGIHNPNIKKFYCTTNDLCAFKQEWVNKRCFAPYTVRSTCRYLANKEQAEKLSREGFHG